MGGQTGEKEFKMYFCIDEKTKEFVDQNGLRFSTDQFIGILERYDRQRKPIDMTLSCQRLIRMNFDWDKLEKFYQEN